MRTQLLLAALLLAPSAWAEPDKGSEPPTAPDFKAPRAWKAEKAGQFASARFSVGEGDAAVLVVVTALKGDGGGVTANVNRWRAQAGLEKLDDEGAKKALRPGKVGGTEAHTLDASGPDDAKPRTRVLVAFVKHDGYTWFFRMAGPADKVKDQKDNFDAFLESVRFEAPKK